MTITRRAALGTALAVSVIRTARAAPVAIDLFFPVPVQGKLAVEMQRLIGQFNAANPDIVVTPVYTGSYDDTNLKTRAALAAGRPPAVAIMSANFIREYAIDNQAISLDPLIARDNLTPDAFMAKFWPALKLNAMEQGHVFGVPFQNSTPLLFINDKAFQDAGLNPGRPLATWAEWVDAGKKLSTSGKSGIVMPSTYDYCGWITSALVMSNGGQYYNVDYGGEVYYDAPTTRTTLQFIDDVVHKHKIMPTGTMDANAATGAFFSGHAGTMLLSTGALGFVRENMKTPFRVAYLPRNIQNAAPIGGGSLIIPTGNSEERQAAAWTLIQFLTSPAIAAGWSRFTGYFAPNRAAYDLPEMKQYLAQDTNARVALDQLNEHGRGWFATYKTVPVRKAMEDQVQAILSGTTKPADAATSAQKAADALLEPYVAQTAGKLS